MRLDLTWECRFILCSSALRVLSDAECLNWLINENTFPVNIINVFV
jgi:hypothetical protein